MSQAKIKSQLKFEQLIFIGKPIDDNRNEKFVISFFISRTMSRQSATSLNIFGGTSKTALDETNPLVG